MFKRTIALILGAMTMTSSLAFAREGGIGSGGGFVDPAERMPMPEVIEAIKGARSLVLQRLNYLEEIVRAREVDAHPERCLGIPTSAYEQPSTRSQALREWNRQRVGYTNFAANEPEVANPPAYLPRLFQASTNVRDFAQNLKIEIRQTQPCYNSANEERDGSVYSSVPGAICISAFTIQQTIPSNELFLKVTALIVHEIAHHVFSGTVETPEPHELQMAFQHNLMIRLLGTQAGGLSTDSAELQQAWNHIMVSDGLLPRSREDMVQADLEQLIQITWSQRDFVQALHHSSPLSRDDGNHAQGQLLQMTGQSVDDLLSDFFPGVRSVRFATRQRFQGAIAKLNLATRYFCDLPDAVQRWRCLQTVPQAALFQSRTVIPSWLSRISGSNDSATTTTQLTALDQASRRCADPSRLPSYAQLRPVTTLAQVEQLEAEAYETLRQANAEDADSEHPFQVILN